MEEHGNTIVGKFKYKLKNPVEVGEISLVLGNFDCSGKEAQNFPSQKFSKTKFFQLEIFPTSNVPIFFLPTSIFNYKLSEISCLLDRFFF